MRSSADRTPTCAAVPRRGVTDPSASPAAGFLGTGGCQCLLVINGGPDAASRCRSDEVGTCFHQREPHRQGMALVSSGPPQGPGRTHRGDGVAGSGIRFGVGLSNVW